MLRPNTAVTDMLRFQQRTISGQFVVLSVEFADEETGSGAAGGGISRHSSLLEHGLQFTAYQLLLGAYVSLRLEPQELLAALSNDTWLLQPELVPLCVESLCRCLEIVPTTPGTEVGDEDFTGMSLSLSNAQLQLEASELREERGAGLQQVSEQQQPTGVVERRPPVSFAASGDALTAEEAAEAMSAEEAEERAAEVAVGDESVEATVDAPNSLESVEGEADGAAQHTVERRHSWLLGAQEASVDTVCGTGHWHLNREAVLWRAYVPQLDFRLSMTLGVTVQVLCLHREGGENMLSLELTAEDLRQLYSPLPWLLLPMYRSKRLQYLLFHLSLEGSEQESKAGDGASSSLKLLSEPVEVTPAYSRLLRVPSAVRGMLHFQLLQVSDHWVVMEAANWHPEGSSSGGEEESGRVVNLKKKGLSFAAFHPVLAVYFTLHLSAPELQDIFHNSPWVRLPLCSPLLFLVLSVSPSLFTLLPRSHFCSNGRFWM
jgi:hypothetical protein